jgi:hypothetical protein
MQWLRKLRLKNPLLNLIKASMFRIKLISIIEALSGNPVKLFVTTLTSHPAC